MCLSDGGFLTVGPVVCREGNVPGPCNFIGAKISRLLGTGLMRHVPVWDLAPVTGSGEARKNFTSAGVRRQLV
jgi:hypothetical protein